MKILLVGVFAPHSTNLGMADALKANGHDVATLDYRKAGMEMGVPAMNDAMLDAAGHNDAIVFCKCYGPSPIVVAAETMQKAGDKCKTVYWFPDSTKVQWPGALQLAAACQVASATSLDSCTAFAKAGAKKVVQIFEGFDPAIFRHTGIPKRRDLVFCGSDDEHRLDCLMELRFRRMSVDRPSAYGDDLCKVYNESRIVLNFARGEIFSDRVMQALACGSFLLTEACLDLEAAFGGTPCMGSFSDKAELVRSAKFWIGDARDRESRAALGNEAVQSFTWQRQMAKLAKVIEGESVSDGAFKV
jgi:hypothetical protein